jgi:hypothetical protein
LTTAGFRRRLDGFSLRWQARLDSEWSDRVLPWLLALGLFVVLAPLALARARSLDGGIELSVAAQAVSLIREGAEPVNTITTGVNYLAQQAAFVLYPIALLTFVVPTVPTLLVVQAGALAVAVVPLWKLCRGPANLRVGAAATVGFVYALYPVVHNLNLDGFHPEVLAVPGLLSMFVFGLTGRWRPYAVCVALVLLSRADLGLAVAGFGGLLVVEGHRRAGWSTLGVGLGWTTLSALVIQPALGDGTFPHLSAFSDFGDAPLSVVWGMLTDPLEVLGRLFSETDFDLVVTLLAPVLFLPVLAPRYLVPVLPLQALYLIADVPVEAVFGQQTVAATAFVFLATVFALSRIGRRGVERISVDRRVLGALLLAGSVFFVRDAASSPYRQPWAWGGQDAADGVRLAAADTIPDAAPVRASPSMLQPLAERRFLEPIDPDRPPDPVAVTAGVDFVVIDGAQIPDWTEHRRRLFRARMEQSGFEVVLEGQDITLYARRGAARNEVG